MKNLLFRKYLEFISFYCKEEKENNLTAFVWNLRKVFNFA